ncbi:MAG: ABC transporter ATP-binding protein [Planctomyces sp.]|jgi:ABC-2 type transport system ATP-binding protein
MSPLIELVGITKDYGAFRALCDVHLQILPGCTGLLGPNGAGKSTLIKVLLGLVRCNVGHGHVLGIPLGTQATTIRGRVGYMPEDDCYIHGLSGIETMQLAARLTGMQSTEAIRRSHEILDFCGAGQERYRSVETYSTGMRQKLRFAMAIVHDPELLILDEPTSGLDPEERTSMLNRIRILARDFGKTILLCTHILPDVQSVCSRVVILAGGQVRISDSLEQLSQLPSPALFVRFAGLAERFQLALREHGITSHVSGPQQLQIAGTAADHSNVIWQAASSAGCVIRGLVPSRNSLEQIFLDAVRQVQHASS